MGVWHEILAARIWATFQTVCTKKSLPPTSHEKHCRDGIKSEFNIESGCQPNDGREQSGTIFHFIWQIIIGRKNLTLRPSTKHYVRLDIFSARAQDAWLLIIAERALIKSTLYGTPALPDSE